ncbi:ScbR family autoregulator-binding transcription factor [Streptomyces sp. NPDC014685]|uniref:ScbR family autoregulator-binding transcription factor n=1 Tax=Streptomyces sp. NPDC014685 TaxID=3364881 RepID=UPI0037005F95
MVKQDRAARTRQSLIRAAAEVFAREGFAPASLTAISRGAGVSNGALHFHFESKKSLARAVEEEAVQVVRGITGKALDGGGGGLRTLMDTTRELMGRLGDDIVVRAGFELGGDPARGEESLLRSEWQQWVEDMLRHAEDGGELAEGVSPGDALPAIMAATVGFEVLGAEDKAWLSEEAIDGFWELVLPGLAGGREQPVPVGSPSTGASGHRVVRPARSTD